MLQRMLLAEYRNQTHHPVFRGNDQSDSPGRRGKAMYLNRGRFSCPNVSSQWTATQGRRYSNSSQEVPCHEQHEVQPERRIVLVRKAWMSTRRMQTSDKGLYKSFALAIPFVQICEEKRGIPVCQPYSPLMTSSKKDRSCREALSNGVQKTFNECAELGVSRRPITPGMCGYSLIEMPLGNCESGLIKRSMNFVIRSRKVQCFRKCSAKLTGLHGEPVPLQPAMQCREPSAKFIDVELFWISPSRSPRCIPDQFRDDCVC